MKRILFVVLSLALLLTGLPSCTTSSLDAGETAANELVTTAEAEKENEKRDPTGFSGLR